MIETFLHTNNKPKNHLVFSGNASGIASHMMESGDGQGRHYGLFQPIGVANGFGYCNASGIGQGVLEIDTIDFKHKTFESFD